MIKAKKGYETVYWGKMPVSFRRQVFRRAEVEEAVRYAERAFPDVSDLVPDFSSLTLGEEAGHEKRAVLKLGERAKPLNVRQEAPGGNLKGLLGKVAALIRARRRRNSRALGRA